MNLNEVPVILSIDPEFRDLIPPLTQEEQQGLLESILEEGCRDPIIVHNNTIIDGHNRYEICREMHIPFRTAPFPQENPSKDDLKIWIIKNQFARRNITSFQRADLALELEPLIAARAKENQRLSEGAGNKGMQISANLSIDTREELAKIAGVSHDTIAKVKKIRSQAKGDLIKKVQSGEVSINEAYKSVRAEEKAQQKQIAIDRINTISEPNGLYHVLVIDPPWQYSKRAEDTTHRGRCIYPTMSIEEIASMNLPDEDDAVVWLWTTNAFMHEAYHILDTWGYTPKTILTWVKDRMGVGDWLRGQTEHCILAVKGKPIINLTNQTTVLNAPLREHSRKPDEFYDMVGVLCPGKNYAEEDEFKGPRMHGSESELILPDLDVCRQGSRIWVEVKTKSDASLHRITGDYVHGFNRKHYTHYLNVEQASGNEVWVIFIERMRGEHRCGKLSEIPIHHTYNGDKMGKHGMVFFNVDHLLPLDILFARLGVPQ